MSYWKRSVRQIDAIHRAWQKAQDCAMKSAWAVVNREGCTDMEGLEAVKEVHRSLTRINEEHQRLMNEVVIQAKCRKYTSRRER